MLWGVGVPLSPLAQPKHEEIPGVSKRTTAEQFVVHPEHTVKHRVLWGWGSPLRWEPEERSEDLQNEGPAKTHTGLCSGSEGRPFTGGSRPQVHLARLIYDGLGLVFRRSGIRGKLLYVPFLYVPLWRLSKS